MSLLLAIFWLVSSTCSAATDTISWNHPLTGKMTLVSGNGKFALGFFQSGSETSNNTLDLYLGIWFDKVPKLTPVWIANKGNPISILASPPELMISSDGNLVVVDRRATNSTIWSTQANITTNSTIAVLLDNGNLVLRNPLNTSLVFWQSFDHPTDTFLPEAKIGQNKATGLNRRLVSRKSSTDQAPGVYSIELGLDGIFRSFWNSSITYWSSGEWNGRFFSSIPEMSGQSGLFLFNYTFVNNDQEVYFSYTMFDESVIVHNLIDVSGQWKTRIWLHDDWATVAVEPKHRCDIYAACGPFTICADNANPLCSCMKGFSVRSPQDWGLGDTRGGCIRNTPLNYHRGDENEKGMEDKFYSVPSIRLPKNGQEVPDATVMKECAEVCLRDRSCTAYSFGKGGCSLWHDELLNVAADGNGETLYLRLAAKEVQSRKIRRGGMIIGVSISTGTISLGLICIIVICKRRTRSGKCSGRIMDNDHGGIGVIAFRYIDLQRATNKFSDKLGEGGFGSVFKGHLSDSIAIAVKRLDGARQGEKQFRAEVSSIGIIQHVNLVKLIGFCCEGNRRLLVYEHMPNGSLDVHLFQCHGTVLDWAIRYQIALGVARGLAYLHHSCQDCIIHCDIKPQNILLDASFTPKIADFGMAKFLGRDFSRVVTTMRGTIGYLAPEWISGTAITSKVDVYSYGMVLLEMIAGKKNSCEKSSNYSDDHTSYFPVQVAQSLLDGDIASLVDGNLHGQLNLDEAERLCKVACWCIQDSEFNRPTMVEVVQFLEGIMEPVMPPMPRLLHAIAGSSS